jgi:hypothetical protein
MDKFMKTKRTTVEIEIEVWIWLIGLKKDGISIKDAVNRALKLLREEMQK